MYRTKLQSKQVATQASRMTVVMIAVAAAEANKGRWAAKAMERSVRFTVRDGWWLFLRAQPPRSRRASGF